MFGQKYLIVQSSPRSNKKGSLKTNNKKSKKDIPAQNKYRTLIQKTGEKVSEIRLKSHIKRLFSLGLSTILSDAVNCMSEANLGKPLCIFDILPIVFDELDHKYSRDATQYHGITCIYVLHIYSHKLIG